MMTILGRTALIFTLALAPVQLLELQHEPHPHEVHEPTYHEVHDPHYHEDYLDKYYQYGYQVEDTYTGDYHGHREHTTGQLTQGEYKVKLPDGRVQVVSYEADENGFRPRISYEPGDHPPVDPHHPHEPEHHPHEPNYHAPEPAYHPPEPSHPPPEPAYHAPEPAYHPPEPAYHPHEHPHPSPEPSYHPAEPAYHPPEPAYHPPEPAYHTPEPAYHPPEPAYHTPEPAYHPPEPAYHPPEPHAPEPSYHPPEPKAVHHPGPDYHAPINKMKLKKILKVLKGPKGDVVKAEYSAPAPGYTAPILPTPLPHKHKKYPIFNITPEMHKALVIASTPAPPQHYMPPSHPHIEHHVHNDVLDPAARELMVIGPDTNAIHEDGHHSGEVLTGMPVLLKMSHDPHASPTPAMVIVHSLPPSNHYSTPAPSYHHSTPSPAYHHSTPSPAYHHSTPKSVYHHSTPVAAHHQSSPAPAHHYSTPAPGYHHSTPEPSYHSTPAPSYHTTPSSYHHSTPSPHHHSTPAPSHHYSTPGPSYHHSTPAHVHHHSTPAPQVHYSTPAPAPGYSHSTPLPVASPSPTPHRAYHSPTPSPPLHYSVAPVVGHAPPSADHHRSKSGQVHYSASISHGGGPGPISAGHASSMMMFSTPAPVSHHHAAHQATSLTLHHLSENQIIDEHPEPHPVLTHRAEPVPAGVHQPTAVIHSRADGHLSDQSHAMTGNHIYVSPHGELSHAGGHHEAMTEDDLYSYLYLLSSYYPYKQPKLVVAKKY